MPVVRWCCLACLVCLVWLGVPLGAQAQLVINDTLNGASSSYPWQSIGGACLTAGNGRGSIPSCVLRGRIGAADPVGSGALRLTDAGGHEASGLVSQFSFPSDQGLQVTFTSVTYGGNGFGGTGADGMSFFLVDADQVPPINGDFQLGSPGGALGYSDRDGNISTGLPGGYLGVGIDEYGNFSNPVDNGSGGPGFVPNTIAIRGSVGTGYAYISGSRVPGSIASGWASTRANAVPITFSLSISTKGLLNLSYSVRGGILNPVIVNQSIATANGPIPAKFHFGFSASSGYGTNIHEITCFKAAGITTSGSSVGTNVLQSDKVQVGTQLYLAYYHTVNWWGQLTAQSILMDPVTQALSINPVANWDASCVLTGGACAATAQNVVAQSSGNRTILTFSGTKGIPFAWENLSSAQQLALTGSSGGSAPARFTYLRGDRSSEGFEAANLRTRTSVLGDIINASPTWVGAAQQPYALKWVDGLYPALTPPERASSYFAYKASTATRTNVVYVGANDGMLHGFRAGAYDARNQYDSSAPNDGRELLAYVPQASLKSLHSDTAQLDYSGQQYAHNAYVDATPGVGDIFYANEWHTWLVSGTGAGGNPQGVIGNNSSAASGSIFALDITNPGQFSEANAASLVKGDWNASTMVCVDDTPTVRCGNSLGNTWGTPTIRRLHDGNWAALFGNGFNSSSGAAGMFIMKVDSATGAISFRYLDTGTGSPTARNGIAYVTSLDIGGDNVIDYVYAGDLRGNVWRFDLTSSDPTQWKVRPQPIFQTGGLPITTQVLPTVVVTEGGSARVMLDFGTGQMQPQTITAAQSPNRQAQYLFGVWDWDMDGWNQQSIAHVASQHAAVAGVPTDLTLSPAQLQTQTISTHMAYANGAVHGVRSMTAHVVCWNGSATCSAPMSNNQFGWRALLPGSHEQVVYNPVIYDGMFVVSTLIPSVRTALSCDAAAPPSGFTMALTADQGKVAVTSYFASATNNNANLGMVAGIGLSAVGTPARITQGGRVYLVTQTSNGSPTLTVVNPPPSVQVLKRRTWIELR